MEIVTNPESATQLVGGSATFNCAASGTPPLTFMWYKDGESAALVAGGSVSISNQPNESSLTLTNIASSDAGAYYCVASNDLVAGRFMSNSTLANLTVQGQLLCSQCSCNLTTYPLCSLRPAIPVINAVGGTTIIGVQGRRLSLRFTISNALPEVTADNIQWFFESTNASQMELRPDSRHTFSPDMLSLTINPLVLSDEGNYTLRVSHITGTVTSTVFLEMQGLYASHVWKYSCRNPIC